MASALRQRVLLTCTIFYASISSSFSNCYHYRRHYYRKVLRSMFLLQGKKGAKPFFVSSSSKQHWIEIEKGIRQSNHILMKKCVKKLSSTSLFDLLIHVMYSTQ
jgi:hypothetical protein